MKAKLFFITSFIALVSSCTAPTNNTDDTSPGVDEYFKADINGYHWEENDDETIAAILGDYGSGPIYSFTATHYADTSHFFYNIPYFHSNDTTWNLSTTPTGMALTFNTDSIYHDVSSGNLHIIKSTVNGMEVFTGTFHYTGLEIMHNSPASFTNGEFVIARIL